MNPGHRGVDARALPSPKGQPMAFPFKAVIFDMDGVIVDTEKFYFDELAVMSEELGLGITEEERKRQVGMSHQDFQRNLQMWMRRGGRGELTGDEAEAVYNEWASHRPRPYARLLNPGVAETVEALREAGAEVLGAVSIFTYGMEKGKQRLAEANVRAVSLTDFDEIVAVAEAEGYIPAHTVPGLMAFRANPSDESWMGGKK